MTMYQPLPHKLIIWQKAWEASWWKYHAPAWWIWFRERILRKGRHSCPGCSWQSVEKNCFVLSATHFPSLKSYCADQTGCKSCYHAFDSKTNKPLFKIAYDQVGSSQALAIAKEHGLPADIIESGTLSASGWRRTLLQLWLNLMTWQSGEKKKLNILKKLSKPDIKNLVNLTKKNLTRKSQDSRWNKRAIKRTDAGLSTESPLCKTGHPGNEHTQGQSCSR